MVTFTSQENRSAEAIVDICTLMNHIACPWTERRWAPNWSNAPKRSTRWSRWNTPVLVSTMTVTRAKNGVHVQDPPQKASGSDRRFLCLLVLTPTRPTACPRPPTCSAPVPCCPLRFRALPSTAMQRHPQGGAACLALHTFLTRCSAPLFEDLHVQALARAVNCHAWPVCQCTVSTMDWVSCVQRLCVFAVQALTMFRPPVCVCRFNPQTA